MVWFLVRHHLILSCPMEIITGYRNKTTRDLLIYCLVTINMVGSFMSSVAGKPASYLLSPQITSLLFVQTESSKEEEKTGWLREG